MKCIESAHQQTLHNYAYKKLHVSIVNSGAYLTKPTEYDIIQDIIGGIKMIYCHVCGENIDTGNAYVSFKDIFVHNDCIESCSIQEYECDGCHQKFNIQELYRVAQSKMCDSCIDKFTEVME
jgi:transposase-like protein